MSQSVIGFIGGSVHTLKWMDDHLEMIDQRVLPLEFNYLSFFSACEVANGIRDIFVRGAAAIGVAAAFGIALEAIKLKSESTHDFIQGLEDSFNLLAKNRPTAVNLFWALNRMRILFESVIDDSDTHRASNLLLSEVLGICEEDILINKKMGAFGAKLLPNEARVLTHCNADALATAGHGTALGVIRSAIELGKKNFNR